MEVSDLHRSLGLESRTPHTLLSTDAGEKVYPSVCPLRSPLYRRGCKRGMSARSLRVLPKCLSPVLHKRPQERAADMVRRISCSTGRCPNDER